ncbi:hypothetical protein HYE60_09235 [Aggregatibacter actinomycetemcomitans]|uniref:hypothetical protein n=1 Tax=Aggregatibacter actinomycetemcomitans TaxID=714 RepID=UPI00197C83FB|nr:hypothetical protein [Aggregatibacter actinomycetemcomitans]MBN6075417.1 hypothetical protein [Aggregatibacter actinomycetemcomitans]
MSKKKGNLKKRKKPSSQNLDRKPPKNKWIPIIFIFIMLITFIILFNVTKDKLNYFIGIVFIVLLAIPIMARTIIFKLLKAEGRDDGKLALAISYMLAAGILLHYSFTLFNEHDKYILATIISLLYGPIIANNLTPILDIVDNELEELENSKRS